MLAFDSLSASLQDLDRGELMSGRRLMVTSRCWFFASFIFQYKKVMSWVVFWY
jgi:hypothetical protein